MPRISLDTSLNVYANQYKLESEINSCLNKTDDQLKTSITDCIRNSQVSQPNLEISNKILQCKEFNLLFQSSYLVEENSNSIEFLPAAQATPDQLAKAVEEKRIRQVTFINGKPQIHATKAQQNDMLAALSQGKSFVLNNSKQEKPIKIENPEFIESSDVENEILYTTLKVYLFYLQHQEKLKNEVKKEDKSQKEDFSSSNSTHIKNHHHGINNRQLKKELFKLTSDFAQRPTLSKSVQRLQQRSLEIERVKDAKLKEKKDKKIKKALKEHKYDALNDVLKSMIDKEMLKKNTIESSARLVKVKEKLDLVPPFSTAVLKST